MRSISAFNYTQNAPVDLRKECQTNFFCGGGGNTNLNNFLVICAGMALTIFFKFQSISSLPSVATDDRKQYHCLNIVLQEQNYTITFGIRLMRKHVLRKQIELHNPSQVFGIKTFSDRKLFSLRKQPTLGDATTGFPAK